MSRRELQLDLVVVGCAVSAGIHVALAPEHFREGTGAGAGFLVSGVLLAALAAVLIRRPNEASTVLATALTLLGLLAAYALAITTGLPPLHPEAEPVEGLALVTTAVEAAGLAACVALLRRPKPRRLLQRGTT